MTTTTNHAVRSQVLSDKKWARWTALALLASAMFFSYIFMDILSPLQSSLQILKGWDPSTYGHFASSETFLNVFIFFLIFAGVILDKMGVRFTAILSGTVMLVGAAINYYALTDAFMSSSLAVWFEDNLNLPSEWWNVTPFFAGMPASAKLSAVGFMIFGCGVEMAGITVSRGIVKWFAGKEMALAMGVEMALARVGVFVVFIGSPWIATLGDNLSVTRPVGFAVLLLLIGLISFIVYGFMDRTLEKQIGNNEEKDDPFRFSDLGKIFSSGVFWIVALLCVLYYSAIFPFQKYAANMLQCELGISVETAGLIFSVFPLGAAAVTPLLGNYLDTKGKGATMLIFGALLMIICHLTFALGLPALRGAETGVIKDTQAIVSGHVERVNPSDEMLKAPVHVVFGIDNFANDEVKQLFVGKKTGESLVFNPRKAFERFGAEDPEASAEALISFLSDRDTQIDFAQAMQIDEDFRLTIDSINEPTGWLGFTIAFIAIILLGISFSLVPASLWPSVPKLVDGKLLGSAYAVIFWIQNIGLYAFPMLIGAVLVSTNVGVMNPLSYNYTAPMLIFASLGVLALLFGLWLKALDAKRHYGLELPNKQPATDQEVELDGME